MSQRFFVLDTSRCFGCHGCVAACATANGTPAGLLWRTLLKLPPDDNAANTVYLSVACNHCRNAPCVRACPSRALEKRSTDGIVIHRAERCLGCRYCQMACPYDAIRWDAARGVVSKCHLCYDRLDRGLEPACVETCFAGALTQVLSMDEDGSGDSVLRQCSREAPGLIDHPGVGPSIRFAQRWEGRPSGPRPQAQGAAPGGER